MRDFTGVDGAAGTQADDDTRWTPEVANAIVNEIAGVITDPDGGNAALNPADDTQLLTAIQGMISDALATSSLRKKGRYIATLIAPSTVYVAFDAAFPTGTTYVLTLTEINWSASSARDNWVQEYQQSEAGFYVVVQGAGTGGSNTLDGFNWVAEAL